MESGEIVEYIDNNKIICSVVMESGNQKLKLFTENNREVKVTAQRLSHRGKAKLPLIADRHRMVTALKQLSAGRQAIAETIQVRELWEILNQEEDWIDLEILTGLCFPESVDDDHQSAVIRAMFKSRRYFRFKPDRFFPNTEDQVAEILALEQKAAREQRLVDEGAAWIRSAPSGAAVEPDEDTRKLVEILKDYYLFEKDGAHWETGKAIARKAQLKSPEAIFDHLVAVGAWSADENLDLLRYRIPTDFSQPVLDLAQSLRIPTEESLKTGGRVDLTHLTTLTIDGQSTLDFDDALSVEPRDGHVLVGIHISDVAHAIKREDPLDAEARSRGSSIYMPDQRISMVPPVLAEDRLSLKKDRIRPAISTMVKIDASGEIVSYDIFASIIRVKHQLSYYEVNGTTEQEKTIACLHDIAIRFREKRMGQGALQITLPEINIWLDDTGAPTVNRVNRESPGRMLIAEMMILSNWLGARFLKEKKIPAVFRSQPKPKERILKNGPGTLFQNWMQRKLLNRFVLRPEPDHHCGLGLDAYVTASSPIRKYFDLVTQRQIRAALGLEKAYTQTEIESIIDQLSRPMANIGRVQYRRNRYWLLKHLEGRIGEKEEAIVLQRRRNSYAILLKSYMIECALPQSSGIALKAEDLIQVTIQHVNARRNILSVFLG